MNRGQTAALREAAILAAVGDTTGLLERLRLAHEPGYTLPVELDIIYPRAEDFPEPEATA